MGKSGWGKEEKDEVEKEKGGEGGRGQGRNLEHRLKLGLIKLRTAAHAAQYCTQL